MSCFYQSEPVYGPVHVYVEANLSDKSRRRHNVNERLINVIDISESFLSQSQRPSLLRRPLDLWVLACEWVLKKYFPTFSHHPIRRVRCLRGRLPKACGFPSYIHVKCSVWRTVFIPPMADNHTKWLCHRIKISNRRATQRCNVSAFFYAKICSLLARRRSSQPVQRVYWPENVIVWLGKWRPTCVNLQLATGIAATTHWSINIALMIYYVIIN
jgi:hypothetical protein